MRKGFIFIVFAILLFPIFVKAADIVCEYAYNPNSSVNVKVQAFYNSGSDPKFKFLGDGFQYEFTDSLTKKDFGDSTSGFTCPGVFMYALIEAKGGTKVQMSKKWLGQGCSYILGEDITSSVSAEDEPTQDVEYGVDESLIPDDHGINRDPVTCDALLPEPVQKTFKDILNTIKYVGPILVIVLTIFDLIKASVSGDAGEMKKVSSKFIKRLISAILLFFVPVLIGIIFDFFDITAPNCSSLMNIYFGI